MVGEREKNEKIGKIKKERENKKIKFTLQGQNDAKWAEIKEKEQVRGKYLRIARGQTYNFFGLGIVSGTIFM